MTNQSQLSSPSSAIEPLIDRFSPENQLPVWMEATVIGGLAFVVLAGPPLGRVVRDKFNFIKPSVVRIFQVAKNEVSRRWKPLNRKRKNGSIIRVVGSVLPNCFFTPPSRIFIRPMETNWNDERRQIEYILGDDNNTVLGRTFLNGLEEDKPSSGEGIVVAYHCEANTSQEVDESEEVDVSSNPEGWECTADGAFYPVSCSTRVSCSTPHYGGPRGQNVEYGDFFNDSLSTVDDFSCRPQEDHEKYKDPQEELGDLKNMVRQFRQLMMEFTTLNQNLSLNQNQTTLQHALPGINGMGLTNDAIGGFPSPPSPGTLGAAALPPPPLIRSVGARAPPPPPPPPMPLTLLVTPQPLFKARAPKVPLQPIQNAVPSFSDVLKDLPNVKLRKIQRSPGGTPIKVNKLESANNLEFVLKKRFESMHSPTDESDGDSTDKENQDSNAFEDSYSENVVPFVKKNLNSLFENQPKLKKVRQRKSYGNKSTRQSNENRTPVFGQHLLKKNQVAVTESLGSSKTLREHNALY